MHLLKGVGLFRLVAVLALCMLGVAACDVDDGQEDVIDDEPDAEEAADTDEDLDDDSVNDDADEGEAADADEPPEPLDDFPRRPIEMTVAYPPGGGQDVLARTVASVGEEVTDVDFRVVNREGSGGLVGNTWAAQEASDDGYDVLMSVNPFLFFDILINDGDFSPEDFEPLVWVGFDPILHVVRTDSEIGEWDYEEILEYAEDNPSDLDVGVIPNNAFQFATIAIEDERDVQFNHVAYDGGGPGVEALLGGHIDMTNAFHAEVDQYLENGELRAVATTEPYEPLPDVPAFSEFGADLAPQTFGAGRFVALPDGVDDDVSQYLHDLFLYILSSEEAAEAFEDAGLVLEPAPQDETIEVYEEAWETLSDMVEEME